MSPTSGQGQAWGRWGWRGFRVAPRQPPPGIHCLTHTATQSALYIHSSESTNNSGKVKILVRFCHIVENTLEIFRWFWLGFQNVFLYTIYLLFLAIVPCLWRRMVMFRTTKSSGCCITFKELRAPLSSRQHWVVSKWVSWEWTKTFWFPFCPSIFNCLNPGYCCSQHQICVSWFSHLWQTWKTRRRKTHTSLHYLHL